MLILTSVLVTAQDRKSAAVYGLIEAERSFAKASATIGRKAAFSKYLAVKSVIFTDKWITNGREYTEGRQASQSILKWEPEYVNISEGRDFGLSTGPWEVQEYRPGTKALGTGYYVSVWEKQTDGEWRVILDAGTSTPPPFSYTHEAAFPAGDDDDARPVNIASSGMSELLQAEKDFTASLKNKKAADFIHKDCRLLLRGQQPLTGATYIKDKISGLPGDITLSHDGSGISKAGDMGFTYGYVVEKNISPGNYLIIWEKIAPDEWRIILLMINPGS